MMPAANQGVGMNMGFPDVCLTPAVPAPVPIPYPNIGMNAMSMPFIPNILVSMAPAQNMGAKPLMTNGDNAGVAHPMCMMPGGTIMGNPRILMGGMPASHLTVPTYGNNFNEPVGAKIVPSVTNCLLGSRALLEPEANAAAARQLQTASCSARLVAGVAVLRLPCIGFRSEAQVAHRLRCRAGIGLHGVVLDLRGNPGGSVAVAHRLAAKLVATQLPLAVAVDALTASAAELLTALLQHGRCARVFGERTYGKGAAMAFLCGADWLRPAGSRVHMRRADGTAIPHRGVRPDAPCAPDVALHEAVHWLATASRIHA
ncbi:MAG TPA: PAAR-like domain-containing protein [Planctomycetota bacterium]|nr:PAAR-like domain-containing protein [Planctomycetota bacterium]